MKFSGYHQQVAPNVANQAAYRTTSDNMAYGPNGKGLNDLAAGIGQMNKVAAQEQDDMDALRINEARNAILTQMNEKLYGENGIFTTGVGGNAKGMTERTTQAIKDTFQDVSKEYNGRIRYALQLNMKDNMDNFQRTAASKEQNEMEKYKTSLENSIMDQYKQDMSDNFADDKIVNNAIYGSMQQMAVRGRRMGWSGEEQQVQNRGAVSLMVGSAIESAMQANEVDRAGQLLETYGNLMDVDSYVKYARFVQQRTKLRDEKKLAEEIAANCKNPDGSINIAKAREMLNNWQAGDHAAPAAYTYARKGDAAANTGNGDNGGATTETIDPEHLFNTEGKADTRFVDTGRELDAYVQEMSQKYNVPTALVHAVIDQESNYDGGAVSSAGAQGLMQLMPDTAAGLGVTDSFDWKQNIEGGTKYLRQCLDNNNGDIHQALAEYNGGPGYRDTDGPQQYANEVWNRVQAMAGTNPLPKAQPVADSKKAETTTAARSTNETNQQTAAPATATSPVEPKQISKPTLGNATEKIETPNLSRSVLSLRARGVRGVDPGDDPETYGRIMNLIGQQVNEQDENNKAHAEELAIMADKQCADRGSALAFIELHKGEFTMRGYNYLQSLINGNEKFAPPKVTRGGGGGGGRRSGGGRSGGGRSGGGRRSAYYEGTSGETYSAAKVKWAQKWMNKFYDESSDPDATISDSEQEKMDEASKILMDIDPENYGSGSESGTDLDNADAFTVAEKVWKETQDYTEAHRILRESYGYTYDEATYYLDNI